MEVGMKINLMNDICDRPVGSKGTIIYIDDFSQVSIDWEEGGNIVLDKKVVENNFEVIIG